MKAVLSFALVVLSSAFAQAGSLNPDGSAWTVVRKTCGTDVVAPTKNEEIRFDNTRLVRILTVTDGAKECRQALVYSRLILSAGTVNSEVYQETSQINGEGKREVCNGPEGKTDKVLEFRTMPANISVVIKGSQGTLQIMGAQECNGAQLMLTLQRK